MVILKSEKIKFVFSWLSDKRQIKFVSKFVLLNTHLTVLEKKKMNIDMVIRISIVFF